MDVYGLIGFPLQHSFSAQFFTEKFRQEIIAAHYHNFEIEDIAEIKSIIQDNPYIKGLNVTIPHKEKVMPFLHAISPVAKAIGAVNVIKVDRFPNDIYTYRLTGYNTDYIGFKKSIEPLIRPEIHKKALVLGTGGASRAVTHALTDLNIEWEYVSRNPGKNRLTYNDLNQEIMDEYKIIINASPIGTFPKTDEYPNIPYQFLSRHHLLYDLVYNPEETLFLNKGKVQGASIKNGLEMLHLQALEAWRIWTTAP